EGTPLKGLRFETLEGSEVAYREAHVHHAHVLQWDRTAGACSARGEMPCRSRPVGSACVIDRGERLTRRGELPGSSRPEFPTPRKPLPARVRPTPPSLRSLARLQRKRPRRESVGAEETRRYLLSRAKQYHRRHL